MAEGGFSQTGWRILPMGVTYDKTVPGRDKIAVRRLSSAETLHSLVADGWVLFSQQPLLSHFLYATQGPQAIDPLVDVVRRESVFTTAVQYVVVPRPVFSGLECAVDRAAGNHLIVTIRSEVWPRIASAFDATVLDSGLKIPTDRSGMVFSLGQQSWSVSLLSTTVPDSPLLDKSPLVPDDPRVPVWLAVVSDVTVVDPVDPLRPCEVLRVRRK